MVCDFTFPVKANEDDNKQTLNTLRVKQNKISSVNACLQYLFRALCVYSLFVIIFVSFCRKSKMTFKFIQCTQMALCKIRRLWSYCKIEYIYVLFIGQCVREKKEHFKWK